MLKRLVAGVVATLIVFVSAVQPVAARGPGGSPTFTTPEALSAHFHGARIAMHSATGSVRLVGGSVGHPAVTRAQLGLPATATEAGSTFLRQNAGLFGIADAETDLALAQRQAASRGRTILRYQQLYRGVPVLAGDLVVDVSRHLDIVSANGEASPDLAVDIHATVTAAAARSAALSAVAKADARPASRLSASKPALWIYDSRLMGTPGAPTTRLVWRLDVTAGSPTDLDELVLIDAQKGGVLLHFNQIDTAAPDRIVCDRGNHPGALVTCGTGAETPVITTDGTGYGAATTDAQRAFDYAGETWTYYYNRFGRDSLDGAALQLKSTVQFCDPAYFCPYQNAYWNGTQMAYGAGFAAADDVDGHELTHGFTEFTSHLFYFYQSGAINEAMSDIMGEFIDQDFNDGLGNDSPSAKWLVGEDIPGWPSGLRNMKDPTTSADVVQPDKMTSPLFFAPSYPYSDNGGVHYNSGVANKAAYLLGEDPTGGAINFNSVNVTPIGRDKAAALFFEVDAHLLTSGSDYADLGTDMEQACQNLLNSTPKGISGAPSASGPFTAANCTQVGNAVTATEMELDPTVSGAAYPEAPICSPAKPTVTTVFTDNAEYTQAQVDANQIPWQVTGGSHWFVDAANATSVDKTANYHDFHGEEIDTISDSSFAMVNAVVIPPGGYLRFNQSYIFESGTEFTTPNANFYDGGRVEYTTDGTTWNDLGPLITVNGYNGTLYAQYGNPLGGHPAFTGSSKGYYSSRADLSSLAGQSVRFRWRTVTDQYYSDAGWYLDDISIYSCAGAADTTGPTVGAPTANIVKGTLGTNSTPVPLKVSFTATDPSGLKSTALSHKYGTGSYAKVTLPSAKALSVTLNVAASESKLHSFQASAKDKASNSTIGPVAGLHVRLRQNTATTAQGLTYTGSWASQSNANFSGGSVKYASSAGRSVQLTLAGVTDFAWVSTLGKDRGMANVYVDGVKKATVDLYAASTKYRQIVFTWDSGGAPGTHTIQIRVLGTKNTKSHGKRVDLDTFVALTN